MNSIFHQFASFYRFISGYSDHPFGALKTAAVAQLQGARCDEMAHAISSLVQRRRWVSDAVFRFMTRTFLAWLLVFISSVTGLAAAERINHDGRLLGPQVVVSSPLLFNTAAADAVVSSLQIMPRDSAWNEDISGRPVAANSTAMIQNIRLDVVNANRQRVVVFKEMNYVLVPNLQPLTTINFTGYPSESDDLTGSSPRHLGAWPIPSMMPVESWPSEQPAGLSNADWQMDINGSGGDRHAIIVMPGTGFLWETWQAIRTTNTPAWEASNGAKFPLTTNAPRPAGWTSGDAAGLPMFPALVRFDEVQRGTIEHAMRIVVKRSRQAYVYPASHFAGSTTDVNVPAMGQRLRLKSLFVVPPSWSSAEQAIARALKKYGALVADNGNFFSISICPDDRWPATAFDHLSTNAGADFCDITNFEVVDATGASEGPRSAGAPTADAGIDRTILASTTLTGAATGTGITSTWSLYATPTPPGTATFNDAQSLTSSVTFSNQGTYTVVLKVSDGVHTPAYDAAVFTITNGSEAPGTTTSSGGSSGSGADSGGGGCGVGSTLACLVAAGTALGWIAFRFRIPASKPHVS